MVERSECLAHQGLQETAHQHTTPHYLNVAIVLDDAIIIIRRLIREAWTTHRCATRPARKP